MAWREVMLELDKLTFETEVLQSEGYILVDFYGDNCAPCMALTPHVHALAEKYGDKIKFTTINTTKARRLAISQKVLGLPVIAIYKGGEKVEELMKEDATPDAVEAMVVKFTSL
jgi:thioredoxin 1